MTESSSPTHYAGFDWARDHHTVVILDQQGQIVADFQFAHTQAGWQSLRDRTATFPNLAVAIETNQGAAVDQLLQAGYTVYPVNPVAAKACRQRKAPSGTKTDFYVNSVAPNQKPTLARPAIDQLYVKRVRPAGIEHYRAADYQSLGRSGGELPQEQW